MTKKVTDSRTIRAEVSELIACLHLMSKGFAVFRNMIPKGPIDFVAIHLETKEVHFIDSKTVVRKEHKARRRHTPEQEELRVIFAYLSPDQAQDMLEDYHINFVNEKGEDIEF